MLVMIKPHIMRKMTKVEFVTLHYVYDIHAPDFKWWIILHPSINNIKGGDKS